MVDKLAETHFLSVLGPSGSGKSSLVNCGLIPALRRGLMAGSGTSWNVVHFRPGGQPIEALANALAEEGTFFSDYTYTSPSLPELLKEDLMMSKRGLIGLFEQINLTENKLLVIVDQFEELFRYEAAGNSDIETDLEKRSIAMSFVKLLTEVTQVVESNVYVVLTMRSDFIGECAQYPGLPEAINDGLYLVPRMTHDERLSAITSPIAIGGADITPMLLTRLINDVGDDPDQLPILQHALYRTWTHWEQGSDQGPLDVHHYQAIGTMHQALDLHAEEAFTSLGKPRLKTICERMFKALTEKLPNIEGIRRPVKLKALADIVEGTEEEVKSVIQVFRDPEYSFLTPRAEDTLTSESFIDISHESLMRIWERLHTWTEEEATSSYDYKRLVESAKRFSDGSASYLTDPELQLALNWKKREKPSAVWADQYDGQFELVKDYLDKSEAERGKERRKEASRRQRLYFLLVTVAILSIATAIYAWIAQERAVQREKALKSEQQAWVLLRSIFEEANPRISAGFGNTRTGYTDHTVVTPFSFDTLSVFEVFDRTTERIERLFSNEPETKASLLMLIGGVYQEHNRSQKASELVEQAIAINDSLFGRQHESVAQGLNLLGETYADLGNYEAAIDALYEALGIRDQLHGPNHFDVTESLNDLGVVLSEYSNSLYALAFESEAELESATLDTSDSLSSLADSLLTKALEIRKRLWDKATGNEKDHIANGVAETMSNLGALYFDIEEYQLAESLLRASTMIREQLPPEPYQLDLVNSLNNLSVILQIQADDIYYIAYEEDTDSLLVDSLLSIADPIWNEADSLAKRALELSEKFRGSGDLDVAVARYNLALLRWGALDIDEADSLFEAARNVFVNRDHFGYLILNDLERGRMLLQQGQCDKADSVFQQIIQLADSPRVDSTDILFAQELLEGECAAS